MSALITSHFVVLCSRLSALAEMLHGTRITLSVDRPRDPDSALRERCEAALVDCEGWLAEAFAEATAARQALDPPPERDAACQHLESCSELFVRMAEVADTRLLDHELLDELRALGARRGGEWRAWAGQVRQALREWREPRHEVLQVLLACWRELARDEHLTIAVHALAPDIASTRTKEETVGDR